MEDNFVCCLCRKIPSNVVESACCNSLFCWDCVTGTPKHCPACAEMLDPTTCTENLAVKKIIDGIEIKCSYAGCQERFLVGARAAHEASCAKGPTLCPNSDLCGIIERGSIAQHLLACQFRRIECHMCELSLPLPNLQEHLDTECQEVVAECQLCRNKLLRKNIPSHVKTACPGVETVCPFSSFGCNATPLRSQLEVHVNENAALHIRLMASAFEAQQIQINTLREQLAITQEGAGNQFDQETGVLYQLDGHLTSFVRQVQSSPVWNHPTFARLREQAPPILCSPCTFIPVLLLFLFLCSLFVRPLSLVFKLVKFMVIYKVCKMGILGRNPARSARARNPGVLALALLLYLVF